MDLTATISHPMVATTLKMVLIFILLQGLSRLNLTARRQASLWQVGLVILLILPALNQFFPVIEIPILTSQLSHETPIPEAVGSALNPNLTTKQVTDNLSQIGLFPINSILLWPLLFIGMISALLLSKLLKQLWQLRHLTQQATPITNKTWLKQAYKLSQQLNLKQLPLILQSNLVNSPSTWGVRKPVILLPDLVLPSEENLSTELKVILLHEMAHIKRGDWVWLMLAKITTALFWFNPLLWFIKHNLVTSFEQACDELVLEQSIKPSLYVETLLQFHNQKQKQFFGVATGMAQHSAMFVRLEHILNPKKRSQPMHKNQQSFIFLTAITGFVLIAVSQFTMAHQAEHVPQVKPTNSQIHESHETHAAAHPARPSMPVMPEINQELPTAPVAPTAIHGDQEHPTAPVHLEHAPVVAPSKPALPEVPHLDQPVSDDELHTKLHLAEAKIKQLEAHIAQKELHAKQQHMKLQSVMTQAEKQKLQAQMQALRNSEKNVKQLALNLSQQQERLMANEHQIQTRTAQKNTQVQQARLQAEELLSDTHDQE
ncbi:MAG: M56 family metallopeptidase [Marinicella sp.]